MSLLLPEHFFFVVLEGKCWLHPGIKHNSPNHLPFTGINFMIPNCHQVPGQVGQKGLPVLTSGVACTYFCWQIDISLICFEQFYLFGRCNKSLVSLKIPLLLNDFVNGMTMLAKQGLWYRNSFVRRKDIWLEHGNYLFYRYIPFLLMHVFEIQEHFFF